MSCAHYLTVVGPNICTDNLSFALYTRAYGFPATSEAHVEVNGKKWDSFLYSKTCFERYAFSYVGTQIALKTKMAKLSSLISWRGDE